MRVSRVRSSPYGDDEVAGRSGAGIRDAMLVVRMNEAHRARAQAVAGAVYSKLDRAFADEPHFGVHVMMRRVRRASGRQRSFVHLQRFSVPNLPFRTRRISAWSRVCTGSLSYG